MLSCEGPCAVKYVGTVLPPVFAGHGPSYCLTSSLGIMHTHSTIRIHAQEDYENFRNHVIRIFNSEDFVITIFFSEFLQVFVFVSITNKRLKLFLVVIYKNIQHKLLLNLKISFPNGATKTALI